MSNQYSSTPASIVNTLYQQRTLLWELAKRDFIGRYKGSFLGVVWSLFNPILMLAIYTFVFSVAFKARWGTGAESRVAFAIVLFSGMIIHGLFSECLNRAPGLITSHANYVKKVVFPLEILPWMTLLSALFHFMVSFCVLLFFCLFAKVTVQASALLVPVALIPLVLMILGLSFVFASLGVYLRDLAHLMGMVTTVALFLAPVFYPVDALPADYQPLLVWNPITLPIIQLRDLMFWGRQPDWNDWAGSLIVGLCIFQAGYWWFQKSRQGFADVL